MKDFCFVILCGVFLIRFKIILYKQYEMAY